MVFESQRKSLIQHCEYILSGQKFIKNAKNGPIWRVFENVQLVVKECYKTGQFQLVDNAKINNLIPDILVDFQTL